MNFSELSHTIRMRKFFFCLLSFLCMGCALPVESGEVFYDGVVEHFFTHCLIAYPEIAFAPDNSYGKDLDRDCLTPLEFNRILESFYQNDYCLVNLSETYRVEGDRAVRVSFPFPKGKKPLVLSFDDVTYASKNQGKGMADKLIVDESGKVATYTASVGELSYERECIPLLEQFVAKHPDFSYHGAKGILCLTGFDGVLGYRTQSGSEMRSGEVARAKVVIEKLRSLGWKFASHSYCHGHMKTYTADKMAYDADKWEAEVGVLVGQTDFYSYPYGEWVMGEDGSDARHRVLKEHGFKVFFGVGDSPFYAGMPVKTAAENKVLFQDRSPMDGYSLRRRREQYLRAFDCNEILDSVRPKEK